MRDGLRFTDFESALGPLRRAVEPYDTVGPEYRAPSLGARRPSRLHAIEELPVALGMLVVSGGDYRHAVLGSVNYGRDCDSIATMAGALAGALGYRVPSDWAKTVAEASRLDLRAPPHTLTEVACEVFERDVAPPPGPRGRVRPAQEPGMLRVTWVQPEDLLGHELRQASRTAAAPRIARRWRAAGGPEAPACAGASPARLPLPAPAGRGPAGRTRRPAKPVGGRATDDLAAIGPPAHPAPPAPAPPQPHRPRTRTPRPSAHAAHRVVRARRTGRRTPGTSVERRPAAAASPAALEAAWLGRAVGCLLGRPVEKLPLAALREVARPPATGPYRLLHRSRPAPGAGRAPPWNRRAAPTSLAENIDGMPEDDDLNYPLLGLLLLQRHGRAFTTADVARLWLDELPAGRTFTAERVAYRNLLLRPRAPAHRPPPQPVPRVDRRPDPRRRPRLDPPRRPGGRRRPGVPRRHPHAHRATASTRRCSPRPLIAPAATGTHDVHAAWPPALTVVPPAHRLAGAVRQAIATGAGRTRDFDTRRRRLHEVTAATTGSTPSRTPPLIAAALTHARRRLHRLLCRAVPAAGTPTPTARPSAASPGCSRVIPPRCRSAGPPR